LHFDATIRFYLGSLTVTLKAFLVKNDSIDDVFGIFSSQTQCYYDRLTAHKRTGYSRI